MSVEDDVLEEVPAVREAYRRGAQPSQIVADVVARDALLQAKSAYLNPTGFTVRAFVFFAIWSLFAWRIYANSTKQDKTHSVAQMHAISRWSAPGLLVLFLSVTLASFDWSMSLDPLSRPQSVFALQKELARETERRYTKLSFSERLKLQLENLKTGAKA